MLRSVVFPAGPAFSSDAALEEIESTNTIAGPNSSGKTTLLRLLFDFTTEAERFTRSSCVRKEM